MTKQYNSILLQIPKKQNHSDTAVNFLSTLAHTKNIKRNNPNLHIFESEENKKISIELIRKMISESSLSIYSGDIKVMILTHAATASTPAQNALLKLIEEPPLGTQIILTSENPQLLLPTILSRCLLITSSKQPSPEMERDPSPAKRDVEGEVKLPKSYPAAIDLSEKYKDRETAIELIENLIINLQKENTKSPSKQNIKNLQILSQTLQNLHANANVRLALEHGFFEMI